jgi:hypothetical protein
MGEHSYLVSYLFQLRGLDRQDVAATSHSAKLLADQEQCRTKIAIQGQRNAKMGKVASGANIETGLRQG